MEVLGNGQVNFEQFETDTELENVRALRRQSRPPLWILFLGLVAALLVCFLAFVFGVRTGSLTKPPGSQSVYLEGKLHSDLLSLIDAIKTQEAHVPIENDDSRNSNQVHQQATSKWQPPQYVRYVRTCRVSNMYRGDSCVPPPCNSGDTDLGVAYADQTLVERSCILKLGQDSDSFIDRSDGTVTICGTDLASAASSSLPMVIKHYHQWTAVQAASIVLRLWGGGGGGSGSHHIRQGVAEGANAWVCGGGGGAGAFVKAVVGILPGHTYRIEVGGGGNGSWAGRRAQAGFNTRFLEMVPGKPWRVLVEAGGGYGAGPIDRKLLYSPGGRGGAMWTTGAHVEGGAGGDGQSSRAELVAPQDILPPQSLVHSSKRSGRFGPRDAPPPEPGWIRQRDDFNIPSRAGFWMHPSARTPCDGSPNQARYGPVGIPGWPCSRKPDYFLTCDKLNPMNCFGAAHGTFQASDSLSHPWQIGQLQYPFLFNSEPAGGKVTGGPSSIGQSAGHGGSGSCPVYKAPEVLKACGQEGKPGLAVIHACARQCSFVLALQRCGATSKRWTLHGLWPGGVANCASTSFNRTAILALEPELAQQWPSCRGYNHDLWKHEWEKHGSCTGLPQPEYFKQSLQLLRQYSDQCVGAVGDCHLCLTAQLSLHANEVSPTSR
mmetsp:Transcript_21741/g.62831  ORF Transcript_21741/g.62831 Transcript_21741/m.62831 type:complete len:659 (-) Transcript_21741:33-2009(-)